jgi:uncharacterized membrane protein YoaK (UPF0700 family)
MLQSAQTSLAKHPYFCPHCHMTFSTPTRLPPRIRAKRTRSRTLVALTQIMVSHRRLPMNDRLLATVLAGVAGAVNAGGFFVVGQYTSHMTGYLSQVADSLVIGNFVVAMNCLLAIFAFIVGASTTAVLVNWARTHHHAKQYALPISVQGVVLFLFAFAGYVSGVFPTFLLLLVLCFLMGMQNATITKLSKARIRTTHVTGMITDIGIELGRSVYGRLARQTMINSDANKLSTLLRLVLTYLLGGVFGALGFASIGFMMALPLSLCLLAISLPTLFLAKRRDQT